MVLRPLISTLFPYTTLFRSDRSRFFNVLLNNVPFNEWPTEFGRISGFPFHDADSADDFGYPSDPQEKAFQMQLRKLDRKSTRLNSSHSSISYAVFCLKKKKI